jgi:hypothetical protein
MSNADLQLDVAYFFDINCMYQSPALIIGKKTAKRNEDLRAV